MAEDDAGPAPPVVPAPAAMAPAWLVVALAVRRISSSADMMMMARNDDSTLRPNKTQWRYDSEEAKADDVVACLLLSVCRLEKPEELIIIVFGALFRAFCRVLPRGKSSDVILILDSGGRSFHARKIGDWNEPQHRAITMGKIFLKNNLLVGTSLLLTVLATLLPWLSVVEGGASGWGGFSARLLPNQQHQQQQSIDDDESEEPRGSITTERRQRQALDAPRSNEKT